MNRLKSPAIFLCIALVSQAFGASSSGIGNVTPTRLLRAQSSTSDWLTGGRDYRQTYYSPLRNIDKSNVHRLGFAWAYDIGANAIFESTPVVVDGVMFTSGMRGAVYAINAKTGVERWRFEPKVETLGCAIGAVNRGVAVWRGKVYVAALDGHLYALDASSGKVAWKVDTIVDRSRGYSSTGAPYVAKDYIVIGNAGAECDARGYVTAYDRITGKQVWRFFIVPGDPKLGFEHPELERAAKTWSPRSLWDLGLGGTAWDGMAYDPTLNLLYVGTGNGTPWPREIRSPGGGDNLFLSSILAINPDTGRLVWHYQTTPGDNWDFTATQKMVLADLKIGGRMRSVIMQAPKNGFFYVLDRRTGELLSADPYATVTWASGVDLKTGRPQETPQGDYSKAPKLIFPGTSGAHNWHPMSYNLQTGLVYIPMRNAPAALTVPDAPFMYAKGGVNVGVEFISLAPTIGGEDTERQKVLASLTAGQPSRERRYFIKAWDPVEHRAVWQFETLSWNGVMSTAGGWVCFGRKDGQLIFLDAASGAQIHSIEVGQNMASAAMSYEIDGEQYIAIMADDAKETRDGIAIGSAGQNGRILAFKLGGADVPRRATHGERTGGALAPPIEKFGTSDQVALGRRLFERHCVVCHAEGGRAPDLTTMGADAHEEFLDIVLEGRRADRGMVSFRAVLSKEDARAIHAHLTDLAWESYQIHSTSPAFEEATK
jgi:quinohemoprotein ethanol dehydrogenase